MLHDTSFPYWVNHMENGKTRQVLQPDMTVPPPTTWRRGRNQTEDDPASLLMLAAEAQRQVQPIQYQQQQPWMLTVPPLQIPSLSFVVHPHWMNHAMYQQTQPLQLPQAPMPLFHLPVPSYPRNHPINNNYSGSTATLPVLPLPTSHQTTARHVPVGMSPSTTYDGYDKKSNDHHKTSKNEPHPKRQCTNSTSTNTTTTTTMAATLTTRRATMIDHAGDADDDGDFDATAAASSGNIKQEFDGERRLNIAFSSLGSLGQEPAYFGKNHLVLPDGLHGQFSALGQTWTTSIDHMDAVNGDATIVRIKYTVTNSNQIAHSRIETAADAARRSRGGRTFCNRVFREAVDIRRQELQAELDALTPSSASSPPRTYVEGAIQLLSSTRVSEGPLFFGLRHACVQKRMAKLLHEKDVNKSAGGGKGSSSSSSSSSKR